MKKIDAVGQACPMPVILTKRALKEHAGEDILVSVDNEIATQNLEKMAEQLKIGSHIDKINDQLYEVTLTASAGEGIAATGSGVESKATPSEAKGAAAQVAEHAENGYVVVLNSDSIGSGADELGHTLMKSFVFALSEQETLPEKILCYNAGAQLTAEGSPVLDDLKAMAAEGVEILTCGICVEFYGLKEKFAVGEITNMYRIVEIERTYKTVSP